MEKSRITTAISSFVLVLSAVGEGPEAPPVNRPRNSFQWSCLLKGRPNASKLAHWIPQVRSKFSCSHMHRVTMD